MPTAAICSSLHAVNAAKLLGILEKRLPKKTPTIEAFNESIKTPAEPNRADISNMEK
jgi:hypothetical protein